MPYIYWCKLNNKEFKSFSLKFDINYGLRRCDSSPSNGYCQQAGITPMVAWDIIDTSETVNCLDVLHPEWVASLFLYLFSGLQVLMEKFFSLPWPLARTAAVTARVMSCRWRLKACRCWTHPGAPGTLFLRETYSSAPSWTSCREQGWEHSCQDFHPDMLRLTLV